MDDMIRYSIKNPLSDIRLSDYKALARSLEESLAKTSHNIEGRTLLFTNHDDYYNYSGITVPSREVEDAFKRREEIDLSELTDEIWKKSYDVTLSLKDTDSSQDSYMITLSCERKAPYVISVYGQGLDQLSYSILSRLQYQRGFFQYIGDGMESITREDRWASLALTEIDLDNDMF